MEKPKEVLVIYRLKFKSKHDFENAVQALRFGDSMGRYLDSLQRSFAPKQPQGNYPMITPPEINFCKDELVIYLCSYEIRQQHVKGSLDIDIVSKGAAERMPRFPYYYELFLKGAFGSIADLTVAVGERV